MSDVTNLKVKFNNEATIDAQDKFSFANYKKNRCVTLDECKREFFFWQIRKSHCVTLK